VVNAIRQGVPGIDHGSLVVLFQNFCEEAKWNPRTFRPAHPEMRSGYRTRKWCKDIQVMDRMMETLDDIGMNCLCWLHWKNISCEYLSLLFCVFTLCSASVSALQVVFSDSLYESTAEWEDCQIFREDRLLVRSLAAASVTKRPFHQLYPEQQFARLWRHTQIMGRLNQLRGTVA
jgi:hypothetical protein